MLSEVKWLKEIFAKYIFVKKKKLKFVTFTQKGPKFKTQTETERKVKEHKMSFNADNQNFKITGMGENWGTKKERENNTGFNMS